ncbi:MAG: LytR/AlgR family response regulator transcription factor [Terriglobales bacterium]|jgi:two-component system LytT family response regulator
METIPQDNTPATTLESTGREAGRIKLLRLRSSRVPRLVIKTGTRRIFLAPEKVEWIQAERDYMRLHVGRESHLVRETMQQMEALLDSKRFLRVHRSTIVNLEFVKQLEPMYSGDYKIVLRDGTELASSRGYRNRLRPLLRQAL